MTNSPRTLAPTLRLLLLTLAMAMPLTASEPTAVVLTYHVVESPSDTFYSMSREAFRLQMEYLRSTGYEVISLSDLNDYVAGRRESIPQNSVVITVDDGWKCTYTEIYPVMKEMGYPFTVFIYPNFIGKGAYALTWKEVREMADDGVDVQSHTYSHPFLTRHSDEGLHHELAESKRIIEEKTGKPVRYLAYPYGDYNTRVANATEAAGYEIGLTCNFGAVGKESNPFRMNRVVIYEKTSFSEFRKLVGANELRLAETEPRPGEKGNPDRPVISARIEEFESLDPASVNLSVVGAPGRMPFSYDPRDGRISLVMREPMPAGKYRAAVWGFDRETGKRREAVWIFSIGERRAPQRVASGHASPPARPTAGTAGASGSGQ